MKTSIDEFVWLSNSARTHQDSDFIKIYDGPLIEGEPIIEGQIQTPSDESIRSFRARYLPLIESIFQDGSDYRVFEVGAGLGNATYGVSQTLSPTLYIASEPFVSLLKPLRANMNSWGLQSPLGVVAAYDANYVTRIKPGSVNLIIVNSVLHHVLYWREFLHHVVDILDSPGLAVFGEPNREAWIYLITIIRSFLSKYGGRDGDSSATADVVGSEFVDSVSLGNLKRFVNSIELRIAKRDDIGFLSKLEDKHIFSWHDILNFCNEHGVELRISKVETSWKTSLINRMKPVFVTPHSFKLFCDELDLLMPTGLEEGLLSEVFSVFGIYKNKK